MGIKNMDKDSTYIYELWAWTYIDGNYVDWHKTIRRKNLLTEDQKEQLSGNFADELAWKYNCNIALYGCNIIE